MTHRPVSLDKLWAISDKTPRLPAAQMTVVAVEVAARQTLGLIPALPSHSAVVAVAEWPFAG